MFEIRKYIISIITVSLISSLAIGITNKMGIIGGLIKLLTGLFLTLTVISPLFHSSVFDLPQYFHSIALDTEKIIGQGQEFLNSEQMRFIKDRTETYILSKAASMGAELEVDIILSDISPNIPTGITISGDVSPYLKQKLQQIITNDLGIQEASQVWI